jgi:lysozyme
VNEAIRLALPIIKKFEGLEKRRPDGRIEAYADPAHGWKVPTIGWGCTGPDIRRGTIWTLAQCEQRLMEEAEHRYPALIRASAILAGQGVRGAAMLDFIFNLGTGNYQSSTLRRRVNEGDWMEAAQQCRKGALR